jgi:hypothetical protein
VIAPVAPSASVLAAQRGRSMPAKEMTMNTIATNDKYDADDDLRELHKLCLQDLVRSLSDPAICQALCKGSFEVARGMPQRECDFALWHLSKDIVAWASAELVTQ